MAVNGSISAGHGTDMKNLIAALILFVATIAFGQNQYYGTFHGNADTSTLANSANTAGTATTLSGSSNTWQTNIVTLNTNVIVGSGFGNSAFNTTFNYSSSAGGWTNGNYGLIYNPSATTYYAGSVPFSDLVTNQNSPANACYDGGPLTDFGATTACGTPPLGTFSYATLSPPQTNIVLVTSILPSGVTAQQSILASNVTAFAIDSTNLNNDGYFTYLVSRLGVSGYSINRYAYKKTLAKLANNQGATILFEGNGLLNNGFNLAMINALAQSYQFKGSINYGQLTSIGNEPINMNIATVNVTYGGRNTTNWFPQIPLINNAAATMTAPYFYPSGGGMVADTFGVYFLKWNQGGNFNIQQSTNGSTWVTVAAINANTNVSYVVGAFYRWTNAFTTYGSGTAIRVQGVESTSTNMILGFEVQNSTITNGILVENYSIDGVGSDAQNGRVFVADSVRIPIWQQWKPDLTVMLYQTLTNANIQYLETNYFGFYQTNLPATEIAWVAEQQTGGGPCTNTWNVAQALKSFGYAYFDGENQYAQWPMGYTNNLNRGLQVNDMTHPTSAGYAFHGALQAAWLGLGNESELASFASNPSNNPAPSTFVTNKTFAVGNTYSNSYNTVITIQECMAFFTLDTTPPNATALTFWCDGDPKYTGFTNTVTCTATPGIQLFATNAIPAFSVGINCNYGFIDNGGTGSSHAAVIGGQLKYP